MKPARPSRPAVRVTEVDTDPVDLDAWARKYVASILELEEIKPRVATPPVASVG